ncbi:MAG: hypothetical protein SGI77_11865 [Pirellulaceae bacterium]|nr:hypothetical protein [Pirellulaceae bacterium]
MNRWITSLAVCALLLGSRDSYAQDDGSYVDEQMAKLFALGPGVHAIQKNKKGRITACVVVGQARISTSLGKAKGMELARDKANLICSAEFVKWLKEEASVYQSTDDESVILLEGGEEAGEDDSLKESSKSVEKNSKKMDSLSKGLVRGLQLLHKGVNADDKTLTIIKGWKADSADGVKNVAAVLASDEPEGKKSKKSGETESKRPKDNKIDKDIESDSATSDDAADFLPKRKKK